jgi:hypothetical protein
MGRQPLGQDPELERGEAGPIDLAVEPDLDRRAVGPQVAADDGHSVAYGAGRPRRCPHHPEDLDALQVGELPPETWRASLARGVLQQAQQPDVVHERLEVPDGGPRDAVATQQLVGFGAAQGSHQLGETGQRGAPDQAHRLHPRPTRSSVGPCSIQERAIAGSPTRNLPNARR